MARLYTAITCFKEISVCRMAFYSSRNNMFHFLKSYFKPSRNISKRNDVKNDLICVVLLGEHFF